MMMVALWKFPWQSPNLEVGTKLFTVTKQHKSLIGMVGSLVFTMTIGACAANPEGIVSSSSSVMENAPIESEPEQAPANTSPLDEYLNVLWGTNWSDANLSNEERQRRFNAEQVMRENLIAECMLESGFTYIPFPEGQTLVISEGNEWRPDDRDWVAQYGYGTFADVNPEAVVSTGHPGITNPNDEIRESLSDGEREAYIAALFGRMFDPEFTSTATLDELWENGGCIMWAAREVAGNSANQSASNDEFAPLLEAIDQMRESLRNEITEADRDWAVCMANAGHPDFQRQGDAQASVQTQLTSFWDNWDWETDGYEPNNSQEFLVLREKEIDLALADLDCRESTDFAARQEARRIEVETQFVNDHRAELEALRSAAEQSD